MIKLLISDTNDHFSTIPQEIQTQHVDVIVLNSYH